MCSHDKLIDAEPGSGLRPIPGIARPHKDPIVNRTTLHLLTIALAIVLAVLLATFDRADMPKPVTNCSIG